MITSLSEDVNRTHRKHQITPIDVAYHQLSQFIQKLNDKIVNRLQLFQQVYAQDYKEQIHLMSEELYQLRSNLDAQILKQKSSERLFMLQEERDFFRMQTMKLNAQVNLCVEENKSLKKKIIDLEVGNTNYKTIAFNYEKKLQKLQMQRNQIVKEMNIKRQASVPLLSQKVTIQYEDAKSGREEREKSIKEKFVQQDQSQIHYPDKEFPRVHIQVIKRISKSLRTKTFSKLETATKASIKRYEQVQEKDHIIDQCIKQIKKIIFHRSNDQKALNNHLFQDFEKFSLEKFTRTDKKNLILAILSNEKMLDEFNDFLISRGSSNTASHSTSRMTRTKLSDQKYNQKFLLDLKRSFNKKMFTLKTNDGLKQSQASKY